MHRKSLLTAILVVLAFGLVTRELPAEEVITEPIRTFSLGVPLIAVAYSPDGLYFATGDNEGASLWDINTGAALRRFSGHTNTVWSVAFSPDGGKVLTGSQDWTAKLWDGSTGACIRTFSGHTSYVRSVAFSPDGSKVLTGSADGTAKLWWECPGDANNDGCVNVADLVIVRNNLGRSGSGIYPPATDQDCDGVCNVVDLLLVRNRLGLGVCQ